jgi:small-conductance mechanosensitive channel
MTMSKLAQLRELRATLAREAQELNAKYPADQRMSAEDAKRLDEKLAQVEACDADIDRENRVLKALADAVDPLDQARERATKTPGAHSEGSLALKAYLGGGYNALSQEQRKALESGDQKARFEGYRIALGRAGERAWMDVDEIRRKERLAPNPKLAAAQANPPAEPAPTPLEGDE